MIFCLLSFLQAQQGQKSGTSRGKNSNSVPRHGCIALKLIFHIPKISPPIAALHAHSPALLATSTSQRAGHVYFYPIARAQP
eukprot:scaffold33052_cov107-Isochrysis_galbana.AAC.1